MPPFPERDSSILAKLKKKRPQAKEETMEPRETKSLPSEVDNSVDNIPTKPIETVSFLRITSRTTMYYCKER